MMLIDDEVVIKVRVKVTLIDGADCEHSATHEIDVAQLIANEEAVDVKEEATNALNIAWGRLVVS